MAPVTRDAATFAEISEFLLDAGYRVRFRARGTSMRPAIADGEPLILAPIGGDEALAPGDVVLCRRPGGLLAHRVVKTVRGEDGREMLLLRGDAMAACDAPISRIDIVARVVGVERNGRVVPLTGIRARARRAMRRVAGRFRRMLPARRAEQGADVDSSLDDVLCATIVDGSLPGDLSGDTVEALWRRARARHVAVLLADILSRRTEGLEATLGRQVAACLAEGEISSLLRYREIHRIAETFAVERVPVLLIKGAGLAHTTYAEPHLRPSRDIDLLIPREARDAAEHALEKCGYARIVEREAELASAQRHFAREDKAGRHHLVDLHWRISNARAFAAAVPFDEAWSASIAIPGIEAEARTLGPADALMLACVHRVAHHHDAAVLPWLWDIHLLAARMTPPDWESFTSRAERASVRAVCARGLDLARQHFGTAAPAAVFERLESEGTPEPTARFIAANVRWIDVVAADFAATRGWRDRLALLCEHLFPQREYMHAAYPRCPAVLLPAAYVDRIVRGTPKWFRRGARDGVTNR